MLYFLPFPDSWKVCAFTVRIIGKSPSASTANSLNCFKTQPRNLAKLSSYRDVKSCTPVRLSPTLFLQLTHPEQDDARPAITFHSQILFTSWKVSRPNQTIRKVDLLYLQSNGKQQPGHNFLIQRPPFTRRHHFLQLYLTKDYLRTKTLAIARFKTIDKLLFLEDISLLKKRQILLGP